MNVFSLIMRLVGMISLTIGSQSMELERKRTTVSKGKKKKEGFGWMDGLRCVVLVACVRACVEEGREQTLIASIFSQSKHNDYMHRLLVQITNVPSNHKCAIKSHCTRRKLHQKHEGTFFISSMKRHTHKKKRRQRQHRHCFRTVDEYLSHFSIGMPPYPRV